MANFAETHRPVVNYCILVLQTAVMRHIKRCCPLPESLIESSAALSRVVSTDERRVLALSLGTPCLGLRGVGSSNRNLAFWPQELGFELGAKPGGLRFALDRRMQRKTAK